MQLLIENSSKNYLILLLSEVICNPPLSTAAEIIMQTKSYESSTMSLHSVVKLNLTWLSGCFVTPCRNCVKWRHLTLFLLTSLASYITLREIKIEMRSLFSQLTRALFYRTNKRHSYATPLWNSYFESLQIQNYLLKKVYSTINDKSLFLNKFILTNACIIEGTL